MKNLILFIMAAGLLLASCTKPEGCDPAQMATEMTAQKNGVLWRPLFVKSSFSAADSLSLSATGGSANQGNYNKGDSLTFRLLCTGIGSYKLYSNQVFYASFTDSGLKNYQIDTTYNNVLNITAYQAGDNSSMMSPNQIKITGTFNVKFIDPNNPAGISFLDGSFNTIVDR
ncbi:MAG TPA: DUF6252 family protein [Mucilaginibacter sp.]|nr:DUF6252 family protein [Mucilaginibacter sp.]